MRITTDHPRSAYGVPVILADDGTPMDYAAAIKEIRRRRGLTTRDLAALIGVSHRTVEGWESGRTPAAWALNVLAHHCP